MASSDKWHTKRMAWRAKKQKDILKDKVQDRLLHRHLAKEEAERDRRTRAYSPGYKPDEYGQEAQPTMGIDLADSFIQDVIFGSQTQSQQDGLGKIIHQAMCTTCKKKEAYMGLSVCQVCLKIKDPSTMKWRFDQIMAHKKKDILEGHKDHEFKQFNDPEDVGKWNKKHEINDDLKKMMGKWYKK